MNDQTSGRAGLGEATALPDAACGDKPGTWGGIERHKRAGQTRCDTCREFANAYSREWYRTARAIPAFRERHNAIVAESHRRGRATPEARAADNKKRRARRLEQQRRNAHDARNVVDEVVVLRLIGGERVPYNRAERIEAVRQMRERGLTYQQVAERLQVTERRVHRDLAYLGMTAEGAVA